MDENKKSMIIHYLTEFILIGIGIGILVILLFLKDFQFSWNIVPVWVFLYNGILFTYWWSKNDSKLWEKAMVGIYFVLIEFIIAGSFVSF